MDTAEMAHREVVNMLHLCLAVPRIAIPLNGGERTVGNFLN